MDGIHEWIDELSCGNVCNDDVTMCIKKNQDNNKNKRKIDNHHNIKKENKCIQKQICIKCVHTYINSCNKPFQKDWKD